MQRVSVRSLRYDGTLRDRLDAELLHAADGIYRIRIARCAACETPSGITLEVANATQLLFADRWYNVNLWYANLAMPATFDGTEILWVDLDLDVICDIERGVMLKDEALYASRVASGFYPAEIAVRVTAARDEILRLAADGAYPFDRERQISR